MTTDDDKRLYEVLLVGAALAVALVAALAAWTAWLGGAAWPLVLAPFALVLAVPLGMLAWLWTREDGDPWSQAPSGADDQVAPHVGTRAA